MKNSKWHLHLLLLLVFEIAFIASQVGYDYVDLTINVDLSLEGKTTTELKTHLKDVLSKCNLVPGKIVELAITPPEDADIRFTKGLIETMEEILPSYIDTPDTAFRVTSVLSDISGFLIEVKFNIIAGFLKAKEAILSNIRKSVAPFVLKITSIYNDFVDDLKRILSTVQSVFNKAIQLGEAIAFVLSADFPEETRQEFFDTILESMHKYLRKVFSKSQFTISVNRLVNGDGTTKKADFLITVFPEEQDDARKLRIDLSPTDVNQGKIIQRLILSTIVDLESRCEPIDIQVTAEEKGGSAIMENMKKTFEEVLEGFSPERKYIITQHTPEENYIENTSNLQIECPRARSLGDESKERESRSIISNHRGLLFPRKQIVIDLSRPGNSVETNLQRILPGILSQIQGELQISNYVSLSFSCKTPPKKRPRYIKRAQKELLASLKKYFKDCLINVSARPMFGYGGFITHIIFSVSLERRVSGANISGSRIEILLDLLRPNINVISELRTIILNLLPKINADIRLGKEISFSLRVKPPKRSDSRFLIKMQEKLRLQLSTYFPHCSISVLPGNKKGIQGYLIFDVEIQPFQKRVTSPPIGNLELNMEKPGASLDAEISIYLPRLFPNLQNILKNKKPASLSCKVKPPRNYGPQYLLKTKHDISAIMQKKFPNRRISISPSTKENIAGNPSEISFDINIFPELDTSFDFSPSVDIDLQKPSNNLKKEIATFLSKLPPTFKKNLDRRISQTFLIKVTTSKSQGTQSIKNNLKEIEGILNNRFPNCYITINSIMESIFGGNSYTTTFKIILQPGKKNQAPLLPGAWLKNTIDVNAGLPGLVAKIQNILKNCSSTANKELSQNKPVGFSYEFILGKEKTEMDLEMMASAILSQCIEMFPDLRLDTSINYIKNPQNMIEKGEIKIQIQPGKRNEDIEWVRYPDKFVLELSKEDSPIEAQMQEVITQLFVKIDGDSNKDQSQIIQFLVKPPKTPDDTFIYYASDIIMDNLSRYFPEYFVEIVSNAIMGDNGLITEILLTARLSPGRIPKEIEFTNEESPCIFEIDLLKNKGSIIASIGKWLQSNLRKIITELLAKPIVLIFNIEPLEKSKIEYQLMKLNEIKELILNLFVNHNTRFEVRGVQDKKGFVVRFDIVVKIEPNFEKMTEYTGAMSNQWGMTTPSGRNSLQIEPLLPMPAFSPSDPDEYIKPQPLPPIPIVPSSDRHSLQIEPPPRLPMPAFSPSDPDEFIKPPTLPPFSDQNFLENIL